MCTLSVYAEKDRYIVTMNRDELRTRKEDGLLHSTQAGGVGLHFPTDAQTGGTWVGVNDQGVALCLLNRYAREVEYPRSRGHIIPEALQRGSADAVCHYLEKLECALFNPFDLFLISARRKTHFQWDGEHYHWSDFQPDPWFMFTSSSLKADEVIAYRRELFDAWCREVGSCIHDAEEILRGFHLIQSGPKTHAVLMERAKSHTKSVSQVELGKDTMVFRYFPEILKKPHAEPLTLSLEVSH